MGSIRFDLRDAIRSLRRDRVYSITVILTLALTLGATTAVFSIVNGVLLEPLAYSESHRLVAVREVWRQAADRFPSLPVNEQHFDYWRARSRTFDSMAQYIVQPGNLVAGRQGEQVTVVRASASLFDVLRVKAASGRTLAAYDERPEASGVVVITDGCWHQRFRSEPGILGRAAVLDGKAVTVVGVLPPGFRLPSDHQLVSKIDAIVPIRLDEDRVGWVADHNNEAIGRLKRGTTPGQALAELDMLQAQVGEIATKEAHQTITLSATVTPLAEAIVGKARRGLMLLLAAIGAVLLIACSNISNLSLARNVSRLRETAVRAALGASRLRLITRLVVEQLLLAATGGAAGVLLASEAIDWFVRTAPFDLPRAADVALDGRVLLFAAATSMLAGLSVAILPAARLASGDVHDWLRQSGSKTTETPGGLRTRAALLVLQVAFSVTLLSVTGLLAVSFVRVLRSDPGFDPRQALAVAVQLPPDRYPDSLKRAQLADTLLERVHGVPGVTSAAWTHLLPLGGQGTVNLVSREGDRRPWALQPTANYRYVSDEFFNVLSIPVTRGRGFVGSDRGRDAVPGVISERTASVVWPKMNPIGQRFRWIPDVSAKIIEVVGVVPDTKTDIDAEAPSMVYLPYWYQPRPSVSLVVRTTVEPASVAPAVRRAIASVDPEIALADARPMEQIVDEALGGRRYQMWLFIAFGAMALTIATVGVYGVTAYAISRRRREMNIRVALGAQRSAVLSAAIRQALLPIVTGLLAGAAGAMATSTMIATLLFDVRPRDPLVLSAVVSLVATVALATSLLAARRGLAVDPAAAMREE